MHFCLSVSPVYVAVDGLTNTAAATLAFAFDAAASNNRQWEIKVSQIPCAASYA